ncbi:MAG: CDP-alcohol phosphatidyltransferase family protein [Chloroflexi bacterium]|nr:CDP-alcohol phosphatidyltransferase family protein [Chloroflexota bacterium]
METWTRARTRWMLVPFIDVAVRLGLTPNSLTVLGFVLNVIAGILVGFGYVFAGGAVMTALAMPLDALDGELARKTNQMSRFGAFFDSTLDRFAEGALLMGLAAYFVQRNDIAGVVITFIALVGSLMVSYTRARAEGLGIDCKVGLFSRFGRFLLLAAGLLLVQVTPMIWALAILSNYTAIERIVYVWRVLRKEDAAK